MGKVLGGMMGLGHWGVLAGVVPGEGIEPTHLFRVADFKSAASTIPPSRPVVFLGLGCRRRGRGF